MGKAIFVTYKYADSLVEPLPNIQGETTARQYVDLIADFLEENDNLFKGEDDGEDLSSLKDPTIASKLGDKIFYSSVTIILVSKGMKESSKPENEQWMPWEISYSLKEQSRSGGKSTTNAVLAVVLPDENSSYEYYIRYNEKCKSRTLMTGMLFQVIRDNMFNLKNAEKRECNGTIIYSGESSYIKSVKWEDFAKNPNAFINAALEIRKNINEYELTKKIK